MPMFSSRKIQDLEKEVARLRRELAELRAQKSSRRSTGIRSVTGIKQHIVEITPQLTVNYANSAFVKSCGIAKDKIRGMNIEDVDLFPWGPGLLAKMFDDVVRSKEKVELERTYQDQTSGTSMHLMLTGTLSKKGVQIIIDDISEIRHIEGQFERFVGTAVSKKMIQLQKDFFQTERRRLAMLFADLRGFTNASERMVPEQAQGMVNEFLGLMIDIAEQHEATIDKLVGDQIMLFFGAPIERPDNTIVALRTALRMREEHERLKAEWTDRGMRSLGVGIGISTGDVVVGNVGSEKRMDYTVIGHHVNVAARLCSAAREGQILVSQSCFDDAVNWSTNIKDEMLFVPIGTMEAKNMRRPLEVYELRGRDEGFPRKSDMHKTEIRLKGEVVA